MANNSPFGKKGKVYTYEDWSKAAGPHPEFVRALSEKERIDIIRETSTPEEFPSRLSKIAAQYPSMSMGSMVGLAQSGADSDVLAAAARLESYANKGNPTVPGANMSGAGSYDYINSLNKTTETASPKDKQDAAWFSGLKTASRYLTTALYTPLQLVTNTARQLDAAYNYYTDQGKTDKGPVVAGKKALDFSQIFKDTYLWQNVVENKSLGQGYFYGDEAVAETERIAAEIATVNGKAYTPGRAIEGMVGIDPGERGYGILSGIVDGVISVAADPVVVASKLKIASELKAARETQQTGARLAGAVKAEVQTAEDIAKEEARITARNRTSAARAKLNQSEKDLNDFHAQLIEEAKLKDQQFVAGTGSVPDVAIQRMREVNNVDGLYKQKDLLLQQVDDLKAGVLIRDAEAGKLLNKAESAKFLRKEIGKVDAKINSVLDNIYVQSDPTIAQMIEAKKVTAKQAADEFAARLDSIKTTQEKQNYIEKRRAGILESSDGYRIAVEDAKNWFTDGHADELFQNLADADNAYEINKLSKGRFGAEISAELVNAQTIDDVERILLPRIGLEIFPEAERGMAARYISKPLKDFVLRSGAVQTATERYGRAVKAAFDFMPTGRPVALHDTEALAEETRRWMVAARYNEDDVAKVWNEIVTSDPHNFQARQRIVTSMLTRTANKYADELNLSKRGRREINKLVKAYESELNGIRQYASREAGAGAGKTIVNGLEVEISDIAHTVTQFASEIALPDVNKLREFTGVLAKVTRKVDERIASNSDLAERSAYAGARFIRSASDGFLRSVLLVGRPAFVIRNIMEMQVRSFLSGGQNLLTNPIATITMLVANGDKQGRLAKLATMADPYTVDINGRRFVSQGMDNAMSQEAVDSYFRVMQERGFSFDARSARSSVASGEFTLISLKNDGSNSALYADSLAHRLMMHRSDPIKRAIISEELPKEYQKLVAKGNMKFEDAFIQAVRDGAFAKDIDIMRKSSEPLRKLLSTDEGMRHLFFNAPNSYKNQMLADTLGNAAWKNYIGTGKVTVQKTKNILDKKTGLSSQEIVDEVLFEMTPDFVKNSRKLSKLIDDELVPGTPAFERAQQLEVPHMEKTLLDKNKYKEFADAFFRLSARAETRAVYGPEYRIGYWESVADLAPLMSKEAAQSFLKQAEDIKKTRVAIENADGTVVYQKWTEKNVAFNDIVEAAKSGTGNLSLKEIDDYARDRAAKRLSNMYYDAMQKRNFTYALQLVVPFANAWGNTIYKWAEFSKSPTRIGSRIEPAINLFDTLQSEESSAVYDVLGTKHDPSQGFIHENLYGEKVFTLPMTGNLRTLFGLFGDPSASDITIPVQSMNLLLAGADLPGSDIGITPGIGNQWNILYSTLPSSIKESVPPVIANIIAPYGDKAGKPLSFLPAWGQKVIGSFFNTEEAMNKFAKPIMAHLASSDPEFIQLYDGTPLSVEERALLQEKLATEAQRQSRWMFGMQGALQAVLPGTPLMEYYAKNQNGDTFFQWQMAKALNNLVKVHNGNYELAYQEYATMFGRQALLATVSAKKDAVFATDRAWQFAVSNPTAFKAYADVLPYFFAGSDFSTEYKVAIERRTGGKALTPTELLAEADRLTISAVKGQLSVYSAYNGLGADWIDEQMSKYKMDTLQGYEPEITTNVNKMAQRIVKVESAIKRPEIAGTPAGQAAIQYSQARAAAINSAQLRYPDRGTPSLSGADNADLRFQLEQIGQRLSQGNPDFANLYQRVYLPELRK